MHRMACKRLLVQRSADAAAQAAVTPEAVSAASLPSTEVVQPGASYASLLVTEARWRDPTVVPRQPAPLPSPGRHWLSSPIRGRGGGSGSTVQLRRLLLLQGSK
uniref:Uncharacterized protein n=1 Tax=Peronospora matthiolae TaxID=2874970 RepID=A0AAV1ULC8_9STRA